MWVALNKKNIVGALSEHQFSMTGYTVQKIELKKSKEEWHDLIGKKLYLGDAKEVKDLRVAFVCNWNDSCGISTYSGYLVNALRPKVKELHVFSEEGKDSIVENTPEVTRCWKRGTSLKGLIDKLVAWSPDFIIIQHEFGIFPKATFFLQFLQGIQDIPYILTMHSVYEHLDKAVCSSAVKNIVVHSEQGKEVLKKLGNANNIFVIPHGCVKFAEEDKTELWNIFQTPYPIVQFGFGFFYKGVDRVLDAIHYLKRSPKYKDIFYCYLCSENQHTSIIQAQYYDFLTEKINELDLYDNAVIIRKFQTDQTIKNYLRTAKIAVFPYIGDPKNMVYGASGAVRIAMACGIPVITSSCHQFDDLESVLPRPANFAELADEIDKIFSNADYKKSIINKSEDYINKNTWDISADRYLELYEKVER